MAQQGQLPWIDLEPDDLMADLCQARGGNGPNVPVAHNRDAFH
jgi:hypothetical protein